MVTAKTDLSRPVIFGMLISVHSLGKNMLFPTHQKHFHVFNHMDSFLLTSPPSRPAEAVHGGLSPD